MELRGIFHCNPKWIRDLFLTISFRYGILIELPLPIRTNFTPFKLFLPLIITMSANLIEVSFKGTVPAVKQNNK